jgi:hypothetical protein
MIASYSDYLVQVMRLIDGDDVSVSEIPRATLEQVIGLAQRRIYRDVRSRYNEKAFASVTVTSNLAAIPSDFESMSLIHFGKNALLPVTEEWLRSYNQAGATGDAVYFASSGTSLMFGPAVSDGTAVQGRYFYRLAELTEANFSANTFIAREPDLFIYAALVEALPFFTKAANQAQVFMTKYEQIKDAVNLSTARTAESAGRVMRSPSARLIA